MYFQFTGREKFSHIISLGHSCQLAWNVRRYFGINKRYPFDWWITPSSALCKFFENPNPEFLFDYKNLRTINDGNSIINEKIGIHYHHDFLRLENYKIDPNIESQLPKIIEKYTYIIDGFFSLNSSNNTICFMRTRGTPGDRLILLLEKRFHDANFTILNVDDSVFTMNPDWKGQPDKWDDYFNKKLIFQRE
jgi:hypothetical protein